MVCRADRFRKGHFLPTMCVAHQGYCAGKRGMNRGNTWNQTQTPV
jgi:hypothetical protein